MTTTTAVEEPTGRGRVTDVVRQAAHFAHEARLLNTLAADAVENGVHAAHQTIKHARETALDARNELTYRVKREPGKALAVVFGMGALLGLGICLAFRKFQTRRVTS